MLPWQRISVLSFFTMPFFTWRIPHPACIEMTCCLAVSPHTVRYIYGWVNKTSGGKQKK
jgi:hypothetical protein